MLKYKRVGNTRTLTGLPGGSFGLERADSTTLFTLGSYRVGTNLRPAVLPDTLYQAGQVQTVAESVSLASLQIESLAEAERASFFQRQLRLPTDPSRLENYAHYGSLAQRLRSALRQVLTAFPAGLVMEPFQADGTPTAGVYSHSYDTTLDESECELKTFVLQNPYELNYHQHATESRPGQPDLLRQSERYVLVYEEVEYPVIFVEGTTNDQSAILRVRVRGQLFPLDAPAQLAVQLLIRPAARWARAQLREQTDELALYLCGGVDAPLGEPTAVFQLPVETDNQEDGGVELQRIELTWPRPDGYHLAASGVSYETYAEEVRYWGETFDSYKTDLLVSRFAPPESLLALDTTEEGKIPALLRIWGRQLDDTKSFIDGLVRVNHLDYDATQSVPDQLVRNLAATLGWQVSPLLGEDQLLQRLFSVGAPSEVGGNGVPPDLDAELWRRIAINSHWFFRAKGTRHAVESMLALLGIPTELFVFQEHAYIGTPTGATPVSSDTSNFLASDPQLTPLYQNTGTERNYLNGLRARGYQLRRVVDNRKVWVEPSAEQQAEGYDLNDDARLTHLRMEPGEKYFPSKEVSLSINPARAWNNAFYQYVTQDGLPSSTNPYTLLQREHGKLVFNSPAQYLELVFRHLVDATSHKTTVGYPTLHGLMLAYTELGGVNNTTNNLRSLLAYSERISRYWSQLIRQLLPATTILTQQALTLSNPVLSSSKFTYRRGISKGSEFRTPQALVPYGVLSVGGIQADVQLPLEALIATSEISVTVNSNAVVPTSQHVRIRPRMNAFPVTLTYPTITVYGGQALDADTEIDWDEVFSGQSSGKEFSFIALTAEVSGPAAPTQIGYTVYRAIGTTALVQVFQEWVPATSYSVFAGNTSVSRRLLPVGVLQADREYVVKVYQRKKYHRGTTPFTPSGPLDMSENYRVNQYTGQFGTHPNFVDRTKNGGDVWVSNEVKTPLAGSYFGNYRKTTDRYFPSLKNPLTPQLDVGQNVRAIERYIESILTAGGLSEVTLAYRPLEKPQFYLGGTQLTEDPGDGTGDYVAIYPSTHPLHWVHYRLRVRVDQASVFTANYRTAYQPLTLVNDSYQMGATGLPFVDVSNGAIPAVGSRIFSVGASGNRLGPAAGVNSVVGFVTSKNPVSGTPWLTLDGVPFSGTLRDHYVHPTTQAIIQLPNVVFLTMQGPYPTAGRTFRLTSATTDPGKPDTVALTGTKWTLKWTSGDVYPADTNLGTRLSHTFSLQAAAETDFAFTGTLINLGSVTWTDRNTQSFLKDVELATSNLTAGTTYLLRVQATKTLLLVNGSQLTTTSTSATYRVKRPAITYIGQ